MSITEGFLSFLTEKKNETLEQAGKLDAEQRKDESDLLKARANIYDVFRAFYTVSEKQGAGNAEETEKLFLKKAETVRAQWSASREKAGQFSDACRVAVEESKLIAVDEILAEFRGLTGDEA